MKPNISFFGVGKISAVQYCVNSICHLGNRSQDKFNCQACFSLWSDIMPSWCDSMFDEQIFAGRFTFDFGLLTRLCNEKRKTAVH